MKASQIIRPLDDNLRAIDRQLQGFSETLQAVSDQWSCARPVVLQWDEHRRVLATNEALGTYRAIYGNDLVRALRYFWKTTTECSLGRQRKSQNTSLFIDALFPIDAVLIAQRSQGSQAYGYVLTIVSELEKRVVKIFSKERKSRFENELNALHLAQAAGISHRVPEIISSGELPNGFAWLTSRLVRNSAVLYPPIIANWLWRRFLLKKLLPDLRRFYEQSGIELVAGCDLLDRFQAQITGHPMSAALRTLIERADQTRRSVKDDRVPLAVVHGDLRPHNVHRYGSHWWLIDWSMSGRAPLMLDLWPNVANALANHGFSAWLRGSTSLGDLSRNIRSHLSMCAEWQASTIGIKTDTEGLRFQVLVTLLHRLSRHHWSGKSLVNVATLNALGICPDPTNSSSELSLAT